jgi:two-component system, OmpR family, sensor histidine kinase VicK
MTGMINSFLNLSRLESGKIGIDVNRFDLALLLKEIEQEANTTITTHRVVFKPVTPTWVTADYDKIAQVIQNLISNAVKYSARNSEVMISCTVMNGHVQLSVQDEGIGIREEDLPRVFERFYRVQDMATKHISGFGIGLFLSAEIIQLHHGKIWAESQLGKGSTFHFELPVR